MNTPFKLDYYHQSAYGNKHFAGIEFFDTLLQTSIPNVFRVRHFVAMINDSKEYDDAGVC
jgi:hypothetical protein